MKLSVSKLILVIGVAAVVMACHKSDEEVEYMEEDMNFDLPAYALAGSTFTFTAGGVTDPEEGVTYKWYSTMNSDTLEGEAGLKYTVVVPDSLATYSVVEYAYITGYYGSTVTKYCTSIVPYIGHSLTNYPQPTDSIKDPRDGQYYYIKTIGNLDWFSENLNYKGTGVAYSRADDIGYIVGRLYNWEDATGGVTASGLGNGPQGACPPGWSVPTNEDWEDLAAAVSGTAHPFLTNWLGIGEMLIVNAKFNGEKFWPYSTAVTPKNSCGWNALSGGMTLNGYKYFTGLYSYAYFWSATEKDSDSAYYRYIYYNLPNFPFNYTAKDDMGASVRCVRKHNL